MPFLDKSEMILDKEEQVKEFGLSEYDDNVLMIKNL